MNLPELIRTFLNILFTVLEVAILIRVLLSWFPIDPHNPLVRIVIDVTDPVIAPFRRILPTIGMIDLSPLAALLVLQFLQRVI